jgi:hypothetical protein
MGSRKSITLTSPERLNKVSEQANKHEAISTHQGLATPAGEILLLVGAGEEGDKQYCVVLTKGFSRPLEVPKTQDFPTILNKEDQDGGEEHC